MMGNLLDRPLVQRLFQLGALVTRGMTLGVRGIALDPRGRVCLVRHTYVGGWHLPGGGVEIGENAVEAMVREFREEAEIVVEAADTLRLHGFYRSTAAAGRDHIAVYVAPAFALRGSKAPDREIAQREFFALDALPEATTRATRQRLDEIIHGRPPAATW
ncbi:NUDIX domain-containing protein [Methylobacterium sp. E-045]|uniref:NUDIX domain-containing protein n=1 Tax=Methylobacterium sp. E-045 TaxID=2836575 RepID=UPI001FBA7CBA|nr:NUDIX domain-containing protein [Methylobacterium sp. E-045]MCJ2130415.1 NUDIX domain-containing protein [Methylobacterium sp. E-045]